MANANPVRAAAFAVVETPAAPAQPNNTTTATQPLFTRVKDNVQLIWTKTVTGIKSAGEFIVRLAKKIVEIFRSFFNPKIDTVKAGYQKLITNLSKQLGSKMPAPTVAPAPVAAPLAAVAAPPINPAPQPAVPVPPGAEPVPAVAAEPEDVVPDAAPAVVDAVPGPQPEVGVLPAEGDAAVAPFVGDGPEAGLNGLFEVVPKHF